MNRDQLAPYRRDLWVPALIGAIGVLVAFSFWAVLVSQRREQLLETTREVGVQAGDAVEASFALQLEMLEGLRELWGRFGLEPRSEWTAAVEQRLAEMPALRAITGVDLDEPEAGFHAGAPRAPARVERDVREAQREREDVRVSALERDASGALFYRIVLPVRTRAQHAGALIGEFAVEPFLHEALRGRASGYALAVWAGDDPVYRRREPSPDPWQAWWSVREPIELGEGRRWTLVQRPTAELAAARLTPVPHYLLSAGLVLALALALSVHQLRIIARQASRLTTSNRALELRGAELESQVARRTAALQDAVEELEAFNYSVSHDLRSPLGAILNFAAILEEDYRERPLDAQGVDMLERIRRSAHRATALLEDLLQLSRAGRAEIKPEKVDMAMLARETFGLLSASDDAEGAELRVEPLPPAAGDRTLLGNVFANLFSNALKYSRGCARREIRVRGQLRDGECVYEVSDTGRGFDMRYVDKIFKLFERLERTDDVEGTGVGLAMVARIVRRHGGRVWAESEPGEGARFFFSLPTREVA